VPEATIKTVHDAGVWAMQLSSVQQALAKTAIHIVPPEHRSTYFQSIINPDIEKNPALLNAAGLSIE
jgi:hypothetical protein